MSERFKVTKSEEPAGKTYKNYGATSAESDLELKGKLLSDTGTHYENLKPHSKPSQASVAEAETGRINSTIAYLQGENLFRRRWQ